MTAVSLNSNMLTDLGKIGERLDALDSDLTELEIDHVVICDKDGEKVGIFTNEIGPGAWLFEPRVVS